MGLIRRIMELAALLFNLITCVLSLNSKVIHDITHLYLNIYSMPFRYKYFVVFCSSKRIS